MNINPFKRAKAPDDMKIWGYRELNAIKKKNVDSNETHLIWVGLKILSIWVDIEARISL